MGIWLVLESITVIPRFFISAVFIDSNSTAQDYVLTLAQLFLTIGIYLLVLRLFILKPSWLIDKLHLERGFEENKIDLNIRASTILSITTIVIGGLMFIEGLPELCRQVFEFFQQKTIFRESPTSGWVIFYSIKTVFGYLLMKNSNQVVAFINKQTNSTTK